MPSLKYYMENAIGWGVYDFKRRGLSKDLEEGENLEYYYRGMQFGYTTKGEKIYASARDVGNVGAGFIAGRYGLPWKLARFGFDTLETIQKNRLSTEGISTQKPEYFGWLWGKSKLKKITGGTFW